MHLKPSCGNYLKVFHFNLYRMNLESTMVGENFRNHQSKIAKNALKTTLWELFESFPFQLI